MTLEQRTEHNSIIRRGTMLVNACFDPEANLMPLDYTEAAWWVAIARETLDGQRSLDLHALIAGTVPAETLHYVATGVQS